MPNREEERGALTMSAVLLFVGVVGTMIMFIAVGLSDQTNSKIHALAGMGLTLGMLVISVSLLIVVKLNQTE